MNGELILSASSLNVGRAAINYAFSGEASFNTLSAQTMVSGSTNLYDIFDVKGSEDVTRVQPGTNIYTAGTDNNPSVNMSAATLDSLTVSGATSLGTLSATTTIYSANTDLSSIFVGGSGTTDYVAIWKDSKNLKGASGFTATVLSVPPAMAGKTLVYINGEISAGTIYSATTNLYDIFEPKSTTAPETFQTLTDAATIVWGYDLGRNAKVTLGGDRDLKITGLTDGACGTLIVVQSVTGNNKLFLTGTTGVTNKFISGGGGVVILTSTGSAEDILSFVYHNSTNILYWNIGYNYTGP